MSLLLYAALAYWGLCATFLIVSMFFECPDESEEEKWKNEQKWELLRLAPSPRRELAIAFGVLYIVLIAPVMAPYWFIGCYLRARRQAAHFASLRRTHRENVYERIHPVRLPKIARRYFEEHAPELLDLGFHEIGRYILKPEPAQSYGYCFQSPDGRTVGVLGQIFDSTYFSFSTLFANGMALETGSVEETPNLARINESSTFRAAFAPGVSVSEVYVRHEQEIAAIELKFDTRALAFEPDQFCDVLTYEGRVFSQIMYELGEHADPPPPPVLPPALNQLAEAAEAEESVRERQALIRAGT